MEILYNRSVSYLGPLWLWVHMFQILFEYVRTSNTTESGRDDVSTYNATTTKAYDAQREYDDDEVGGGIFSNLGHWSYGIGGIILLSIAVCSGLCKLYVTLRNRCSPGLKNQEEENNPADVVVLHPPSYISAEPPPYTAPDYLTSSVSSPSQTKKNKTTQVNTPQQLDVLNLSLPSPPQYEQFPSSNNDYPTGVHSECSRISINDSFIADTNSNLSLDTTQVVMNITSTNDDERRTSSTIETGLPPSYTDTLRMDASS